MVSRFRAEPESNSCSQQFNLNKKGNKQMKTITNIMYPVLAVFTVACFALSPAAHAVTPAPDGGYPGQNTAEGDDALFSLSTGTDNTAIGFDALYSNTTGSDNTANGLQALLNNTTGGANTANGVQALLSNTTGNNNTANGFDALVFNTTAGYN